MTVNAIASKSVVGFRYPASIELKWRYAKCLIDISFKIIPPDGLSGCESLPLIRGIDCE
jgi:hypothetical protein